MAAIDNRTIEVAEARVLLVEVQEATQTRIDEGRVPAVPPDGATGVRALHISAIVVPVDHCQEDLADLFDCWGLRIQTRQVFLPIPAPCPAFHLFVMLRISPLVAVARTLRTCRYQTDSNRPTDRS